MSVYWYYSVNGVRSEALQWSELRQAVTDGKFGPDDYIWTPSFGSEWRKASTFEALFPPQPGSSPRPAESAQSAEPPPTSPKPVSQTGETDKPVEIRLTPELKLYIPVSPFSARKGTRSGSVFDALKFALSATVPVLFTGHVLRRWLLFAVCALLASNISVPVPFAVPNAGMAKKMNLEEVASSGIFKMITDATKQINANAFAAQAAVLRAPETMKKLWNDICIACRETCIALAAWSGSRGNVSRAALFALGMICIMLVVLWFSSQGQTMMIVRVFRPTEPLAVTWNTAASPARKLFMVLAGLRIMFMIVNFCVFVHWVGSMAAIPEDSIAAISSLCLKTFAIFTGTAALENFVAVYVRDFSAVRLLLSNKNESFFKRLFHGFGFWYLVYLFAYTLLWGLCLLVLSLIVSFTGSFFPYMVLLAFFMPVVGLLLSIPFRVTLLIWRIELMFMADPELRGRENKLPIGISF